MLVREIRSSVRVQVHLSAADTREVEALLFLADFITRYRVKEQEGENNHLIGFAETRHDAWLTVQFSHHRVPWRTAPYQTTVCLPSAMQQIERDLKAGELAHPEKTAQVYDELFGTIDKETRRLLVKDPRRAVLDLQVSEHVQNVHRALRARLRTVHAPHLFDMRRLTRAGRSDIYYVASTPSVAEALRELLVA